ncbi:MAG: hypothetical protein HKL91_04130 [Candidatus Eremiobacteraeota bacterium]|nr:hypothetical protein [Candidatus Eremiobacteraeota bacterium]
MIENLLAAAAIGALANGGPCTAARVIAGSAFYRGRDRGVALSAFTFGAFVTDVALVSSLGLFYRALQYTGWLYALAAVSALLGALWILSRPAAHTCTESRGHASSATYPILAYPVFAGCGSALLLGACCAPFVFAAAATVGRGAGPIAIALAYSAAHAGVPLVATILSSRCLPATIGAEMREATVTIQAGLLVGCAIYFGVLA